MYTKERKQGTKYANEKANVNKTLIDIMDDKTILNKICC